MPASITASARTRAIAGFAGITQGRDNDLTITLAELAETFGSIVIGTAATQPATFAAVTAPQTWKLTETLQASFRPHFGGGTDVSLKVWLPQSASLAWTTGQHVWLCVFDEPAPSGTDAPVMVADLGELFSP